MRWTAILPLTLSALVPLAACSSNTTYVVGGDGGGGGGPGGGTTVSCEQKSGADTDKDCEDFASSGKPRKLDCDADQTDSAIAAGCSRINPGGSDVCCPTTVKGSGGENADGGSGDGGSSGSCTTSYAGTWSLSGTCPVSSCSVTQTGCALVISCSGGTSLSGSLNGTNAVVTGSSNGTSLTCSITFSSTSAFNLSCGSVCSGSGVKGGGA